MLYVCEIRVPTKDSDGGDVDIWKEISQKGWANKTVLEANERDSLHKSATEKKSTLENDTEEITTV